MRNSEQHIAKFAGVKYEEVPHNAIVEKVSFL